MMVWEVADWSGEPKELMISFQLKHVHSFFGRLRNAWNYLFKRENKKFDFMDTLIYDVQTLEEMKKMIDEVIISQKPS